MASAVFGFGDDWLKGFQMPQSASDKTLLDRIDNDFTYHAPTAEQAALYARVRAEAKTLALTVASLCPDGREKSLALTKLEECVMWANAGIARSVTPV